MKRALLLVSACLLALEAQATTFYVIVAGLGGEPDYEQRFTTAANDLGRIFKSAGATARVYTCVGTLATAARFRDTINTIARDARADDDFVLILIGHGSFDGVEYKFNLPGPDVTAAEIAAMCDRVASRRRACGTCSAPPKMSRRRPGRPGRCRRPAHSAAAAS